MRFIVAVAVCAVAFAGVARADVAPPEPSSPPPEDIIDGTWSGPMRQVDVAAEKTYPMVLTLNGDEGTSDYPTLNCGGALHRLGPAGDGYVVYEETITRGGFDPEKGQGCIDGVVTIYNAGDALVIGWFAAFDGKPSLASARLERKAAPSH